MTGNDNLTPWARAGGYDQKTWLKCINLSTKEWMAADAAVKAALTRQVWDRKDLDEFQGLVEKLDSAYADHRAVLAGDAEVVGRFFDQLELGTGGAL